MTYTQRMDGSVLTNVRANMRKYLAENKPFCEHLKRDVPLAQSQLDVQITEVERQIEAVREHTKRRIAEMLDLKKFHEVRQFQESQAQKLEPLNNQITELTAIKKEIQDGVKVNQKRQQEQVKAEAIEQLKKKKDRYRDEVAVFNGYKMPTNLIKSIHDLFTALHGATLERKCQYLITLPERHEQLVQLRAELESEGASEGLYDVPKLSEELVDEAGKTEFRIEGILGYDPRTEKLVRDGFGNGHLQPIQKNHRGGGGAALQRNLELQARQNEAARKELVKEGLI